MSGFREGYYVVENDRNHYAAETKPEVIAGPFDNEIEAGGHEPADGDGFEYYTVWIDEMDRHLYEGV